ncbi:MAG: 16S rRNA (cytidine(1402)-2'-O)-methyltransferase [Propionibacteriaceae bacterium]|jgi:16S rRNA (cytidine1402-2'-O)-methyltransferase|nr:16S rRNA (cytidine(1402)-2'-O)-methyltransferase [Propionibacteriaceae bacterium]
MTGRLILAGTPIGDVADAPPSLIRALEGADLIAAEDTRRVRALAARLGVTLTAPVTSYFDGNEAAKTVGLVAALRSGQTVVVVTDAGLPGVSDPGYRVVRAAIDAGLPVTAVPGPSAVTTALILSGLPTDRFCFEGFPPRKAGPRAALLGGLAAEERTMVFFEAPHRLAVFLAAARDAFGPSRPGAICREMTKTHEEVVRGSLSELAEWAEGEVRGEVTVVIAGCAGHAADGDKPDLVTEVQELIAEGLKPSAAVARVAAAHHYDRRALYEAVAVSRRGGLD